jgi:hypothetical protein
MRRLGSERGKNEALTGLKAGVSREIRHSNPPTLDSFVGLVAFIHELKLMVFSDGE